MIILYRRLQIILLLAILSLPVLSQGTAVKGTVADHRNVPIVGVRVCQAGSANCTASDMDGVFNLILDPESEHTLSVTCPGFIPAEVEIDETTIMPVRITLVPMYLEADAWARREVVECLKD